MKGILFSLLLTFAITGISQSPTSVWAYLKDNISGLSLYSQFKPGTCDREFTSFKFTNERLYLIIGDSVCDNTPGSWNSYAVYYNSKIYYGDKRLFADQENLDATVAQINKSYPSLLRRLEQFKKDYENKLLEYKNEEEKQKVIENERKEKDQLLQNQIEQQLMDSLIKINEARYAIMRSKNIILYNWSWSYSNEYSSYVDVTFTVNNPYKKRIKYIWFTVQGLNPVDDLVKDGITGKTEKTLQGVGPIEYGDKGSYKFESVIYSKVIESMKIKMIKIQFFDGSIKIINSPISLDIERD